MSDAAIHIPSSMAISIRQAEPADIAVVSSILCEAARWLEQRGMPL